MVSDGILIKSNEARVDESSLTGESEPVKKNKDKPFLLSGCTLVEGNAFFLVLAVGPNSEWGKIMTELDDDRPDTPLQVFLPAFIGVSALSRSNVPVVICVLN